jgi:hypothetical protein
VPEISIKKHIFIANNIAYVNAKQS